MQTKPHAHQHRKAFTLVELLAVIAIFAVLLALLAPALKQSTIATNATFQQQQFAPSLLDKALKAPRVDQRDLFVDATAPPPNANLADYLALINGGKSLLKFEGKNDGTDIMGSATLPITGLLPASTDEDAECVVGIDTDIRTARLYAITSRSRLVEINAQTGAIENPKFLSQRYTDRFFKEIARQHFFYIDSGGLFYNFLGRQEKWLRSDRNVSPSSYFYIVPDGTLVQWGGGLVNDVTIARLNPACYKNVELLVNGYKPPLTTTEETTLQEADKDRHFYRCSKGNFSFNTFGQGERWIKGQVSRKSAANRNNPWYYILPRGVFEWDGSSSLSGTAVPGLTGDLARKIHNDPSLLYHANQKPNLVGGQIDPRYVTLDQRYKFFFDRSGGCCRNLYEDGINGLDVKWFGGSNNLYYGIRPNGDVFRWDGMSNANGTTVGNLGPEAWDNIEQVVHAWNPPDRNDTIKCYDWERCFYRDCLDTNYYYNSFGLREKWICGLPSAKTAHRTNPYYYILPNGDVYEWDGGNSPSTSTRVFEGLTNAWVDPNWLCDAFHDGTVMTSPCDYCSYDQETVPDVQCGDHLLCLDINEVKGFGCDIDPTTFPAAGDDDNTQMLVVIDNFHTFCVNVRKGWVQGFPAPTDPLSNERYLAACAHDNAGDICVVSYDPADPPVDNARIWELNKENGNLTMLTNDLGFLFSPSIGLEVLGDGVGTDVLGALNNGPNGTLGVASDGTVSFFGIIDKNPLSLGYGGIAEFSVLKDENNNNVIASDITINCNP